MEKNTLYAKYCFSETDEDLIDELDKYLDENVFRVYEFFGLEMPKESITIHIVPTKKEYDESEKKRRGIEEIPNWSIGNYHDGVIEYVSLHDYKNTSHAFPPEKYKENLEYYKKTFLHEYVHYVTRQYLRKNKVFNIEKWFNEGIATFLSGQRDGRDYEFTSTLESITNSRSDYIGWFLLVKYIINEYGRDYFLSLIKDNELSISLTPRLYEEAKEYYGKKEKTNNINK